MMIFELLFAVAFFKFSAQFLPCPFLTFTQTAAQLVTSSRGGLKRAMVVSFGRFGALLLLLLPCLQAFTIPSTVDVRPINWGGSAHHSPLWRRQQIKVENGMVTKMVKRPNESRVSGMKVSDHALSSQLMVTNNHHFSRSWRRSIHIACGFDP